MKTVTQRNTCSLAAYKKHLIKLGFRQIGTGADARVFIRKGDNYVLKVGPLPNLRAAIAYVNAGGKRNSWRPKVYEIRKMFPKDSTDTPYAVIVMERLYSLYSQTDADRWTLGSLGSANKPRMRMLETKYQQPGLTAVMDTINKVKASLTRCLMDIHCENVMVRKVGTKREYVVTDPLHQSGNRMLNYAWQR